MVRKSFSVPYDNRADIAYAVTVNKHLARRHFVYNGNSVRSNFDLPAVIGNYNIAFWYAQRLSERGMLTKVLLLTVYGDKEFRSCKTEHKLQLLLTGVSRNMHLVHSFVDNLCAELQQFIHYPADSLFIAGNGRCGNNNVVIGNNRNPSVLAECHSVKRRHRLALTARCDNYHFIGRIIIDAVNAYK